jgi:hypothetical protein
MFGKEAVQLIVRERCRSAILLVHQHGLARIEIDAIPSHVLDSENEGEKTRGFLREHFKRVHQGWSPGVVGVKAFLRQRLNGDGRPAKGGNDQITLSP